MSDWIHCLICQRAPNNSSSSFLLMHPCMHIVCENCKETSENCKKCGNKCMSVPLTKQTFVSRPEVGKFFKDPTKDISRCLKEFNRELTHLFQVLNFQDYHRKEKLSKLMAILMEKDKENKLLREEVALLRKQGGGSSARSTPHAVLMNSVGQQSQSPIGNSTLYGQAMRTQVKTPTNGNSRAHSHPCTPMASRLSVRTPPVHGRLGPIAGTPSPSTSPGYPLRLASTPSGLSADTPKRSAGGTASPMNISPTPSQRISLNGLTRSQGGYSTPTSYQQFGTSQSLLWSSAKRQQQLPLERNDGSQFLSIGGRISPGAPLTSTPTNSSQVWDPAKRCLVQMPFGVGNK
ncbi:uncharacterized protein LOC106162213 isoform X2 [Lingula anatina]|uniref:Uncharacterized protein LOC106162213 isoform X2 n=1 Tax=Lingula anatina TaxID=7574 RepID=A0A1S3I9B2_LINAN|nr:uncharacterized protein LOC106162213 isoform X2 [Lingula anatina]|eukprot:XP_013394850.1 uncharacterized protein LOC106162213 isoform X2 [Lingula anatina]